MRDLFEDVPVEIDVQYTIANENQTLLQKERSHSPRILHDANVEEIVQVLTNHD